MQQQPNCGSSNNDDVVQTTSHENPDGIPLTSSASSSSSWTNPFASLEALVLCTATTTTGTASKNRNDRCHTASSTTTFATTAATTNNHVAPSSECVREFHVNPTSSHTEDTNKKSIVGFRYVRNVSLSLSIYILVCVSNPNRSFRDT
jgi:hypothetical protein